MSVRRIMIVFAAIVVAIGIGLFLIPKKETKGLSPKTPESASAQTSAPIKPKASAQTPKYDFRKEPAVIADDYSDRGRYKRIFRLNPDGKPLEYYGNEYRDNGNGTITDHATGLTWHKAGSESEISGDGQDKTYIDELNSAKFAGYADWRLPTIDELKSLIEPEIQSNDLHISPIFVSASKERYLCKSSDKDQYKNSWGVDFKEGKVVNHSYYAHIRAVRP